jgi:hypothetical protein
MFAGLRRWRASGYYVEALPFRRANGIVRRAGRSYIAGFRGYSVIPMGRCRCVGIFETLQRHVSLWILSPFGGVCCLFFSGS